MAKTRAIADASNQAPFSGGTTVASIGLAVAYFRIVNQPQRPAKIGSSEGSIVFSHLSHASSPEPPETNGR